MSPYYKIILPDIEYNRLDFTMMGGEILVPFNNFTLGLIIPGVGIVKIDARQTQCLSGFAALLKAF